MLMRIANGIIHDSSGAMFVFCLFSFPSTDVLRERFKIMYVYIERWYHHFVFKYYYCKIIWNRINYYNVFLTCYFFMF